MNILDIVAIIIILLGGLLGFKRGAVKGLIQLIGFVAITIIAYVLKDYLGDFLIKIMPFFNFKGFEGLYTLNILFYQGLAFALIFVLLYCILNILISLAGFVDVLVKMTLVFELPSKIIGTIIGLVEGLVFVFIISFVLSQVPSSRKFVDNSAIAKPIVEKTPIVNAVFARSIVTTKEIYSEITDLETEEDILQANLVIIRAMMKYGISDAKTIQSCIDNGKLHMDTTTVAS